MIVDDEELTRKALHYLIQNKIPEITAIQEARNGDDAIALAQKTVFDIVLMDIKMPGKDGLTVTKELKKMMPNLKVIVITAFDNFDFAQLAVKLDVSDYLLKPIYPKHLIETVKCVINEIEVQRAELKEKHFIQDRFKKVEPLLVETFFEDLFNGTINNEVDFYDRANMISIKGQAASIINIQFDRSSIDKENSVFLAVEDLFEEHGLDKDLLTLPMNQNRALIICKKSLFNDQITTAEVKSLLDQIYGIFKKDQTIKNVRIGMGRFYDEFLNIRLSYLEALIALWMLKQNDDGVSVYYEELPNLLTEETKKILKNLILNGDIKNIRILFKELLDERASISEKTLFYLEIVIICSYFFNEFEISFKYASFNLKLFIDLMNQMELETLAAYTYKVVDALLMRIPSKKSLSVTNPIALTLNYIETFLCDNDLTLEAAAKAAFISPSYLSKLFKNEIGKTFKQYILEKRMDKAKELLKNTNLQILEIGKSIGYSDSSYFCKLFKEKEGLTPTQYRLKKFSKE